MSGLPKNFPVRRRGSCVPAAYLIARACRCDVVQGFVEGEEHTWIEVGETIVDPTIRQFRWYRKGVEVSRHEMKRFSASEFVAEVERRMSQDTSAGRHYRKILSPFVATPTENELVQMVG